MTRVISSTWKRTFPLAPLVPLIVISPTRSESFDRMLLILILNVLNG
jgi:hypothetical protein